MKTFVFEYTLGSRPGQFVNVWIPRVDEKPMSVAYDGGKEFWLTVFAVGPFSKRLHEMKKRDLVGIRGPFGNYFSYEDGQHLITVGGGYGAAPLFNLSKDAVKKKCTVDYVVGARSKEHLLFLQHVKKLRGVRTHIATDDGSAGIKGYNTLILERLLQERKKAKKLRGTTVFAVGPEMMMKRVSDICFTMKVPCQVSLERYMKCGFGVCGNCSVDDGGFTACTEGPAMDHLRARALQEFGVYHRDSVGRKHVF